MDEASGPRQVSTLAARYDTNSVDIGYESPVGGHRFEGDGPWGRGDGVERISGTGRSVPHDAKDSGSRLARRFGIVGHSGRIASMAFVRLWSGQLKLGAPWLNRRTIARIVSPSYIASFVGH